MMDSRLHARARTSPIPSFTAVRGGMLQRKCACGGTPGLNGECEACGKKRVQRKTDNAEGETQRDSVVPPIVRDILRSPGQPLDVETRAFMEPRFGHDFSNVRVHTDAKAAESARAVNAHAFTVGRKVVFGRGQYVPRTSGGRSLLAHELVHVLQQQDSGPLARQNLAIHHDDALEHEADEAMRRVDSAGGLEAPPSRARESLQRKVAVDKPDKLIPNPGGKGVSQTNAATAGDYLAELCSGEKPKVNATGDVTMSMAFCSVPAFHIGHEVLPAGPAPAEEAKTATGCTCLCDLVNSKNLWTIKIDDASWPHTDFGQPAAATGRKPGGSGGVVTTLSPNSPKVYGAVSVSGKKIDYDPWLILGHELCGHGWLANSGKAETAEVMKKVGRQPFTIDRENALRAEHALESRGRSFRDPFCGESYERLKTDKPGTGNFDPDTMATCKRARSRCKKPDKTPFKIEERIPDDAAC